MSNFHTTVAFAPGSFLLNVLLITLHCAGKAKFWKEDGATAVAGLAAETELHPYVSFTLNFD